MRQRGAPRTEVMHPFGNLSHPGREERESASTPGLFFSRENSGVGLPFIYYEVGVTGFTKFTGGLKKFPYRGEKNFFRRPVNPVNLVTGEPESGIGVQGVQGVQGKICAGCAGVHGLFSKSLCRCARSFQKLFCRCAGVHGLFKNFFCPGECIPKTFSNRSAPCTGAQKLFQITLHRCTESFSNHPAHRAQDLCKSPCTPCTPVLKITLHTLHREHD